MITIGIKKVTVFQDERGNSLAIQGDMSGEEIEYGGDNTRAKAKETVDLPEEMSGEEAQEWIEENLENENSVLHQKLQEHEEDMKQQKKKEYNSRKLVRCDSNAETVYRVKQYGSQLRSGVVDEQLIGRIEVEPYTSFRRKSNIGEFAESVYRKAEDVQFDYDELSEQEEEQVDIERQIYIRKNQRRWDSK